MNPHPTVCPNVCPKCAGDTKVIDSRPSSKPIHHTRRRRICLSCEHRYTTYETMIRPEDQVATEYTDPREKLIRVFSDLVDGIMDGSIPVG